jgi:hypothetical protein
MRTKRLKNRPKDEFLSIFLGLATLYPLDSAVFMAEMDQWMDEKRNISKRAPGKSQEKRLTFFRQNSSIPIKAGF